MRRAIESIPKMEARILGTSFEFGAEEDISFSLIGEDEPHFSLVFGVSQNSANNLKHGSDTSAASDEGHLLDGLGLVVVGARLELEDTLALVVEATSGALDVDGVADLELLEVLGHLATVREFGVDTSEVDLDDELDETKVGVAGDGSVAASNDFVVDGGAERHVLADGKSKDLSRMIEGKTEDTGIGRDVCLLNQTNGSEFSGSFFCQELFIVRENQTSKVVDGVGNWNCNHDSSEKNTITTSSCCLMVVVFDRLMSY